MSWMNTIYYCLTACLCDEDRIRNVTSLDLDCLLNALSPDAGQVPVCGQLRRYVDLGAFLHRPRVCPLCPCAAATVSKRSPWTFVPMHGPHCNPGGV